MRIESFGLAECAHRQRSKITLRLQTLVLGSNCERTDKGSGVRLGDLRLSEAHSKDFKRLPCRKGITDDKG